MPMVDQRVCNCVCHADGREDDSECCAYKAQCERDELRTQLAEARAEVERLRGEGIILPSESSTARMLDYWKQRAEQAEAKLKAETDAQDAVVRLLHLQVEDLETKLKAFETGDLGHIWDEAARSGYDAGKQEAEAKLKATEERIADLECISGLKASLEGCEHKAKLKAVVEAAKHAQCSCSVSERESGHRVECWMPMLLAALAAAKEKP